MEKNDVRAGDKVYVIYRNPHAANVANIQQAEVVDHPTEPGQKALFIHDSYHLLDEEDAIFPSYSDAEEMYNKLFDYEQYE
ncbi:MULTISPECIES: transcriptional regulator SplA domain-containing protein [Metabacillus]|uniref:Transcriptional regulator n=1 Tax=Metabacillus indicus TaxID=246786 RepID=A0A084H2Y9_METID|nr:MULTISPECIES: transcriptional regulator SplA domain-containing protein [Metabacillus]KEZ52740.1 transcriptional regulator [Metabacillus indicus LMG 22858]KEZ53951.1 transcriptional regulator [Metabacillus indicus]MDX8291371.1 transcriptional regulator SplA domain-containing protein [Metabacillus indicus]